MNIISRIRNINWCATIGINYHVGGMTAVWRMPVKVYGPLRWNIRGRLLMPANAPRNTFVIGSLHEDYTAAAGKAELNISGTLKINGEVRIGPDAFVGVMSDGLLEIGDEVFIGRDSQIHCYRHIAIGSGVFSGEVYINDSASHVIVDNGKEKERDGDVVIGEGTYLGFRTMLLKGSNIPPRSVIASAAVCTKDFTQQGSAELFIAGVPAEVKKKGVRGIF